MRDLIDCNAFVGRWPFSIAPELSGAALARHLGSAGVTRAFVSPFDAVFCPDPMPGNRALFAQCRRVPQLQPVPVINPALATWREHLDACIDQGIRAVRILPSYHNFALTSPRLAPFMAAIATANVRLVLTVRLEDERQTYFALRIKGVPVARVSEFLRRHARQHVLCTGLYLGEVEAAAKAAGNFSCELSFAEWAATLPSLRALLPAERILFGSGAPLLSVHAQAAKLRQPEIRARERHLISGANAQRFFSS